jgi:hypothetical protein
LAAFSFRQPDGTGENCGLKKCRAKISGKVYSLTKCKKQVKDMEKGKPMKKGIASAVVALALLCGLLSNVSAQKARKQWTGYITDKKCSARGADHTRDCVLKCKDSGVGLFVDGKFYQFDEKGSAEAIKLMEASSSEKVVKAVVRGELNGETLIVKSIREAKASKSKA